MEKRQDILIEAAPDARRIAVLADSNVATLGHLGALEKSAHTHGKELVITRVSNSQELISGIDDARARGAIWLTSLGNPSTRTCRFGGRLGGFAEPLNHSAESS